MMLDSSFHSSCEPSSWNSNVQNIEFYDINYTMHTLDCRISRFLWCTEHAHKLSFTAHPPLKQQQQLQLQLRTPLNMHDGINVAKRNRTHLISLQVVRGQFFWWVCEGSKGGWKYEQVIDECYTHYSSTSAYTYSSSRFTT